MARHLPNAKRREIKLREQAKTAKRKRQAKRIRVYFASLGSNQIAELDEDGRLIITTFQGYCKGMERTFMATPPTFAANERVSVGSSQERRFADYRARNAQPFYEEPNQGTRLYR